MMINWLAVVMPVVLAIASACFLIGQLYARTRELERQVANHTENIEELNSKAATITRQFDMQFKSLKTSLEKLKEKIPAEETQLAYYMSGLPDQIGRIRKDLHALLEQIRQRRTKKANE